jgi:hypothetical protein
MPNEDSRHAETNTPPSPGGGPTFSAGRDIKGAFATAPRADATAHFIENTVVNSNFDIAAALRALRVNVAHIPDIAPSAETWMLQAEEEASKPQPDRAKVGELVSDGITFLTKAGEFTEAVDRLAPYLTQICHWAGTDLPAWAAALNIG